MTTECEPMSDDSCAEEALAQAAAALAALESALRAQPASRAAVAAALVAARAPCRAADDALAQLLAACAAADTTRAVRDALQAWRLHERAQPGPRGGTGDSAALEREAAERLALVQRVQTLRDTLAREARDDTAAAPAAAAAAAAEPHENTQSVDSLVALLHTQAQHIEEALAALAPEQTPPESP